MEIHEIVDAGTKGATGATGLGALGLWWWINRLRGDVRDISVENDKIRDRLSLHAEEDAKTFATRDDLSNLRHHIDEQFREMRTFIMDLVRER